MAVRIAPLYLLSGVGGSILSCVHQEGKKETVSVGASGALFGMLGAMFSELIANWTIYANKVSTFLIALILVNVNGRVTFRYFSHTPWLKYKQIDSYIFKF